MTTYFMWVSWRNPVRKLKLNGLWSSCIDWNTRFLLSAHTSSFSLGWHYTRTCMYMKAGNPSLDIYMTDQARAFVYKKWLMIPSSGWSENCPSQDSCLPHKLPFVYHFIVCKMLSHALCCLVGREQCMEIKWTGRGDRTVFTKAT